MNRYHDRLLGVGQQSNSKSWLEVFGEIEKLGPGKVVPGHGRAGSLEEISRVDQSEFRFLGVFDQIAGRNAHPVFQEMEFDF